MSVLGLLVLSSGELYFVPVMVYADGKNKRKRPSTAKGSTHSKKAEATLHPVTKVMMGERVINKDAR